MLHNHNIYAEILVQTLAGFMVTASVSVSPCELGLVNSMVLVRLVSFIFSGFYSLLWHSQIFKKKDLIETSDLVFPNNIWLCVSAPAPIC